MKSFLVVALLAVCFSGAIAGPRTQPKVQIKKIVPLISFEELIQLATDTVVALEELTYAAGAALDTLLEGNPLQQTVRDIIHSAHSDYETLVGDAVWLILHSTEEEIPEIIGNYLEEMAPLVIAAVENVRTAVENESHEIKEGTEAILFKYTHDLVEAVHPLIEAISGEARRLK